MTDSLITTTELADFIKVPKRTLEHWRIVGDGPRFIRVGRQVRYAWSAVTAWLESNTFAHTAEADAAISA
jgi:excisionase family DNA binding protein